MNAVMIAAVTAEVEELRKAVDTELHLRIAASLVRVRTPKALRYERWIDGRHLRRAVSL